MPTFWTSDWPRSYVLVSPEGSTNPFTGAQYHAISPNGDLIVGNNVEYSIEFMRDGVAHKRLRLPYVPIQVGDAEWRQWRDWSAYMSDNNSGGITFPAPPKSKPAFRDVWVDRAGRLWIQRHAAASRVPVSPREPGDARPLFEWRDQPTFDIVDPDGVLLGQVTFPRGVRIYDAIGRTVLATHTDEQGVPFVVLYTIR